MSDMTTILLEEIKALRLDVQHQSRELHQLRDELQTLRPENEKFVTPKFVAGKLGLEPRTVRQWCELGKIQATQPGKDKSRWKIPYKEFERIKKEAQLNHFNKPRA